MQIFLYLNGEQVGPFTEPDIRSKVASGEVSQADLGWHEGLAEWRPLNAILSIIPPVRKLPPPRPIATPQASSLPVACPTCGGPKWRASDPCQICANARIVAASNFQQQPIAQTPKKVINKGGAWCPHCGNRNSYSKSDGTGCLTLGILFISLIGILFIPFLPKTWHCRECGHTWK